jgi:hypothetical protein
MAFCRHLVTPAVRLTDLNRNGDRVRQRLKQINARTLAVLRVARDLTTREKQFLLSEMVQIKGLMPLLMKERNKQRWTPEDRAELRTHLRRLSSLSPYLVVMVLPGSFLMLPALAWWLDRRRGRNRVQQMPG